jgi:F0F1-type ATP synthase membrane subunit b/b'
VKIWRKGQANGPSTSRICKSYAFAVGMKLAKYLELNGYSKDQIVRLLQHNRISVLFAGNTEKPLRATSEELEIGYGDRIHVDTETGKAVYHLTAQNLRELPARNPAKTKAQRNEKQNKGRESGLWQGLAGGTGFVLGGPLSAFLAYYSAKILIQREKHVYPAEGSRIAPFRFETFFLWFAVGSLAMPVSWWITRSLGWNLDVLAVVQSRASHISYKSWSEAEEASREAAREKREAEQALERQTREAQWRKRQEEERRKSEQEAAAQREEEARLQAEEQAKNARIQQELDKWRDPVRRQEREEAHRRHLLSVGCIDDSGEVIRTLFCLNTEAPPQ